MPPVGGTKRPRDPSPELSPIPEPSSNKRRTRRLPHIPELGKRHNKHDDMDVRNRGPYSRYRRLHVLQDIHDPLTVLVIWACVPRESMSSLSMLFQACNQGENH